jgi:hypothetical protein
LIRPSLHPPAAAPGGAEHVRAVCGDSLARLGHLTTGQAGSRTARDRPSPGCELVGRQEWDWDRYAAELGLPDERLAVGRELVNLLSEAIAEKNLPWKPAFRKGYAAFQRRGGYNTMIVDVSWRKTTVRCQAAG